MDFSEGKSLYIIGFEQYDVLDERNKAEWEDFYERLLKVGFASFDGHTEKGNPIYKLERKAFDYVDEIRNSLKKGKKMN